MMIEQMTEGMQKHIDRNLSLQGFRNDTPEGHNESGGMP